VERLAAFGLPWLYDAIAVAIVGALVMLVFRPGDPVELLGGDPVVAEPQRGPHYTAIYLAEDELS
jgi:hypothetical protein